MLKAVSTVFLAILASAVPQHAQARPAAHRPRCAELPGANELLASGKHIIVFGEMHGTAETPALFADFVCAAAKAGPVVVGLEIDHEEQGAIDAFLASNGGAAALARLRATDHFEHVPDGRSSLAMLAMIERLRAMKSSGLPIRVEAFVPRVPESASQTPYEKAMAERWRTSIAAMPGARFVGLVGNLHALRKPVYGFEPAAMHVPPGDILTLTYAQLGGAAWNCQADGCKPHSMGDPRPLIARGILQPAAPGSYDFLYSPGSAFTASPPVNPHAADPPSPAPKQK